MCLDAYNSINVDFIMTRLQQKNILFFKRLKIMFSQKDKFRTLLVLTGNCLTHDFFKILNFNSIISLGLFFGSLFVLFSGQKEQILLLKFWWRHESHLFVLIMYMLHQQ